MSRKRYSIFVDQIPAEQRYCYDRQKDDDRKIRRAFWFDRTGEGGKFVNRMAHLSSLSEVATYRYRP
ncbi:MAG: hypothetical protein DHS20C06_01920 [Hyphobacterium sp.]|nr:MAG: hypothetical protein DHS20C06_01920 [Hyphobacterium sp.]